MTSGSNALIVPKAGRYTLTAKAYVTGGTGYNSFGRLRVDGTQVEQAVTWKHNTDDYSYFLTRTMLLSAGAQVTMSMGNGSTWGTSGYNGSWIEVLWVADS